MNSYNLVEDNLMMWTQGCKNTNSNTIWYLSTYEEETIRNQYKSIIYDAGFKGEVGIFTAK